MGKKAQQQPPSDISLAPLLPPQRAISATLTLPQTNPQPLQSPFLRTTRLPSSASSTTPSTPRRSCSYSTTTHTFSRLPPGDAQRRLALAIFIRANPRLLSQSNTFNRSKFAHARKFLLPCLFLRPPNSSRPTPLRYLR